MDRTPIELSSAVVGEGARERGSEGAKESRANGRGSQALEIQ
jgi:hypothetical protein